MPASGAGGRGFESRYPDHEILFEKEMRMDEKSNVKVAADKFYEDMRNSTVKFMQSLSNEMTDEHLEEFVNKGIHSLTLVVVESAFTIFSAPFVTFPDTPFEFREKVLLHGAGVFVKNLKKSFHANVRSAARYSMAQAGILEAKRSGTLMAVDMIEDDLTKEEKDLVIQHAEGLAYELDEACDAYVGNAQPPDLIHNAILSLSGSTLQEFVIAALLDTVRKDLKAIREYKRKQQLQVDEEKAALKSIEALAKKLYPHETDPLRKAAEVIFERNNS